MHYKVILVFFACLATTALFSYYYYNDLTVAAQHYYLKARVQVENVHFQLTRLLIDGNQKNSFTKSGETSLKLNMSITAPNKLFMELEPQLNQALAKATEHVIVYFSL